MIQHVFTSHWRNGDLADLDATMISVSRGTPRRGPGFSYRRLDALAPSDEAWAHDDTEAFEAAYIDQLEALGASRVVSDIEHVAGGKPAVLLCWERPTDDYCHRWVLSRWIRDRTGVVIPELRPGMLPQRDDAVEMRLF